MAQAFGVSAFGPLEEQVRRNMEMFEKAFGMFAPFARRGGPPAAPAKSDAPTDHIDEMKRQLDEMQKRLDQISDKDKG